MRIALVAPLFESVPPSHYGGTERVIAALADELVNRGHDVTLFATQGSQSRARVVAMAPAPLRTALSRHELEHVAPHLHLHLLSEVYRRSAEFDIIHSHADLFTLPFVDLVSTPTLLTLHGRLDIDQVQQILPRYSQVPLASISRAQRQPIDHVPLRWIDTCYNGLELGTYFEQPSTTGDYLAFVGRVTDEKRPDRAIEVALRTGMPLRMAAKVDPLDQEYWTESIEPLITSADVDFVGEISETDKPGFLAGAAATLFPIDWPEPFGLVLIESLAAGTPVIAIGHGSVPEIIEHGVSGFVVDDVTGMIEAVGRIDEISPDACRRAARRFNAQAMTDRYEEAYATVLAGATTEPVVIGERVSSGPTRDLRLPLLDIDRQVRSSDQVPAAHLEGRSTRPTRPQPAT